MTPASTVSAGHLIVRQLETEGIERIYCVPGESYLDVLDGLYDSPIETIVCRQEGGVGFMALAEGRLTGRPGIAAVTRGPGAANAFISIHTAWQDATPMVLLVGLIPTELRGRESFQEFDITAWFGSTAKKVLTIDDPESAAEVIADACATAVSGRPGPVVVGLPEERLLEATSGRTVPRKHRSVPTASAAELAEVEKLVASAARPVLIVGGEDWHGDTPARLARWASAHGVGIVADFRAYDAIEHDEPNYLGALGYGASPVTTDALAAADLLIFLDCVRNDVNSRDYTLGIDVPTVLISPDANGHGHFGRREKHIVSTTSAFAELLEAPAAQPETTGWIEETRREFLDWREPVTAEQPEGFVDVDAAFDVVRKAIARDTIVTFGAGNHSGWASRFLPSHGFGSMLGPRNGAMGFGIPAAVAAAKVHPDRKVLSVAGDGCFMMNGQELAGAAARGSDITVIVVDNSSYGTIVAHQIKNYPGRPSGTHLDNPDFAALARSYGGLGFTVSDTADFAAAFDEAYNHPGTALIHVLANPDNLVPRT